jgi:hypothetical protein
VEKLKHRKMFENITKGEAHNNLNSVIDNYGNVFVRCNNGNGIKDAEFISYCFNLQQKYDISKYSSVISALEELLEACNDHNSGEYSNVNEGAMNIAQCILNEIKSKNY